MTTPLSGIGLLWCAGLIGGATVLAIQIPPRSSFSGPLFLVAQGEGFHRLGYAWAITILLIVGCYFIRPTKRMAVVSLCGVALWFITGFVVRNIADW